MSCETGGPGDAACRTRNSRCVQILPDYHANRTELGGAPLHLMTMQAAAISNATSSELLEAQWTRIAAWDAGGAGGTDGRVVL